MLLYSRSTRKRLYGGVSRNWRREKYTSWSESSTSSFTSCTRRNLASKTGMESFGAVGLNCVMGIVSACRLVSILQGALALLLLAFLCLHLRLYHGLSISSFIKVYAYVSDFQHKITVQASPSLDRRWSFLGSNSTPPNSPPVLPRLRAIQCKYVCVAV